MRVYYTKLSYVMKLRIFRYSISRRKIIEINHTQKKYKVKHMEKQKLIKDFYLLYLP